MLRGRGLTMDQQNKKVDEFLMHYGVLGMRWGKRKGRTQNTSTAPRRMSNKELQARVKRLKLEQEYAKLSTRPETPSKLEKMAKTAGTMAALTTAGITLYKNMDTIAKIAKTAKKAT